MALEPYRQRTSRPTNSSPTQGAVSTQVSNAAAAGLQNLGNTIVQAAEPRLQRKALEQAAADFAAQGLGKDENGNYVIPEARGGGTVYKAAFEQAGRERFVMETTNDAEAYLNDLYSDPDKFDADPEALRQDAMGYVRGLVEAAPPAVQGALFNQLTREIKQRDLNASNKALTRNLQQTQATLSSRMEQSAQKLIDLQMLEQTAEVQAEALAIEGDVLDLLPQLARLNPNEDFVGIVEDKLTDIRGYGEIFRSFEANIDQMTPEQMVELSMIVEGTKTGSMGGYGTEDVQRLIKDPAMRGQLAKVMRARASAVASANNARSRAASDEVEWGVIAGIGQGSLSDAKYAEHWQNMAAAQGVDPYSPDGFMAMMQMTGGSSPPDKFYKDYFEKAHRMQPDQLLQAADLYEFMQNAIDPVNGNKIMAQPDIDPRSRAMMYHMRLARDNGNDLGEAHRTAYTMVEQGFGMDDSDMRGMLYREFGFTSKKEGQNRMALEEALGGAFGWLDSSFEEQSPEVRDYLLHSVAQNVAMGMDKDAAIAEAGRDFQANFVQDPLTSERVAGSFLDKVASSVGFNSGLMTYVRKDKAVPQSYNFATQKNDTTWAKDLLPNIVELADKTQHPGMPKLGSLEVGKDLHFVPTGQDGLYYVTYRGEQSGGRDIFIRSKESDYLILNLGAAAEKRNQLATEENKQAHVSGWAKARTKIEKPIPYVSFVQRAGKALFGEDDPTQDEGFIQGANANARVPSDWLRVNGMRSYGQADVQIDTYMQRARMAESSGNDAAKNPDSSATGRYQFIDSTWVEWYDKTHPNNGLSKSQKLAKRLDGGTQDKVMRAFTQNNARLLQGAGVPVNQQTLYAMHFLGPVAGLKIWRTPPQTSIANVVSQAALEANRHSLAWNKDPSKPKTVGEVMTYLLGAVSR